MKFDCCKNFSLKCFKDLNFKIKYDVQKFKLLLLVFCMLYVQCIVLMLVLTAAACGIYSSEFQSDGSLALYALAVTTVNVILVMLGTAVVGIYAALKLSRFVIACHGLGMCSVIVLKMMLVIPFILAVDSAAEDNLGNLIKIFEVKNKETIDRAQYDLRCCGTHSFRYYNGTLPLSCCPKVAVKCFVQLAYSDGCFFKIQQMSKAPALITSVAMIMMIVLEVIGLAISYGLLKSIAIRDGTIDFRAMFKERMEQINATLTKPFQKDGFASNMIETIKKKTNQIKNGDDNDEKESKISEGDITNMEDENDETSKVDQKSLSLASFAEMKSTIINVDQPPDLPPHI